MPRVQGGGGRDHKAHSGVKKCKVGLGRDPTRRFVCTRCVFSCCHAYDRVDSGVEKHLLSLATGSGQTGMDGTVAAACYNWLL